MTHPSRFGSPHIGPLGFVCFALAFAFSSPSIATNEVLFNDGQTHVIDGLQDYRLNSFTVRDSAGGTPTTLRVEAGEVGFNSDYSGGHDVFDQSILIVNGGLNNRDISVRDSARATISGGQAATLSVFDSGHALVTGGSFVGGPRSDNDSSVLMSGASTLEIRGGDLLGAWWLYGSARADVYGGNIASNEFMELFDDSTLVLYGVFDLPYGSVTTQSTNITGTLLDGTSVDFWAGRNGPNANIILLATPEPSTAVLLALGLAAISRRPRQQDPEMDAQKPPLHA